MTTLLKNQIDLQNIKKLALSVKKQTAEFDVDRFIAAIVDEQWQALSLKQRIRKVSRQLNAALPGRYCEKIHVLLKVHSQFSGLFHFIFADFVEVYGLDDFEQSITALQAFTQLSTAEFAVRPFIDQYPDKMHTQMLLWSKSNNEHLRRLASEGVRPRLPWAKKMQWIEQNPNWVKPIIRQLNCDESSYVKKSVANLLNDFTKTNPAWVLKELKSWPLDNDNAFWIAKHALRTLLKQGNSKALRLLGYPSPEGIVLSQIEVPDSVARGDKLKFSFNLSSIKNKNAVLGLLRLEYAIYFVRKNSEPYRKVFKISELTVNDNAKLYTASHDFKSISTRTYYSGVHLLEIIVNGQVMGKTEFKLT